MACMTRCEPPRRPRAHLPGPPRRDQEHPDRLRDVARDRRALARAGYSARPQGTSSGTGLLRRALIPKRPIRGDDAGEPRGMTIREALPEDRDTLVRIWLRSVRATHTFLSEDDIQSLLPLVRDELGPDSELELWGTRGRGGCGHRLYRPLRHGGRGAVPRPGPPTPRRRANADRARPTAQRSLDCRRQRAKPGGRPVLRGRRVREGRPFSVGRCRPSVPDPPHATG